MEKIIVIPDVHGRTFWKEVVNGRENETIVFLGDYVDPYAWEGINKEDVIKNLEEIIEFKKAHPHNVILLLGNHDFGGYISEEMVKCRFDYKNHLRIRQLFLDNIKLFEMGYVTDIGDIECSFSHSMVSHGWTQNVDDLCDCKSVKEVFSKLNSLLYSNIDKLVIDISHISRIRGGYGRFGSVVWADVDEFDIFDNTFSPTYQIFGHSQQEENPIITNKYACLDCRRGFEVKMNDLRNGLDFMSLSKTTNIYDYDV